MCVSGREVCVSGPRGSSTAVCRQGKSNWQDCLLFLQLNLVSQLYSFKFQCKPRLATKTDALWWLTWTWQTETNAIAASSNEAFGVAFRAPHNTLVGFPFSFQSSEITTDTSKKWKSIHGGILSDCNSTALRTERNNSETLLLGPLTCMLVKRLSEPWNPPVQYLTSLRLLLWERKKKDCPESESKHRDESNAAPLILKNPRVSKAEP